MADKIIPNWCRMVCGDNCKLPDEQLYLDKKLNIATKYGNVLPRNPRNAFGTVWFDGDRFRLYWCDFKNVYLSFSDDGLNWKSTIPVLFGENEPDDWDNGIDCASVFKDGAMWYMLYRGHYFNGVPNLWPHYAIGLASSFDGITWFKCPDNPVMQPDENSWDGQYQKNDIAAPFDPWGIIKIKQIYCLWFNSENPDTCRTTGLAYSEDLVHWRRDERNPIFVNGRFCVCPFKIGAYYYLIVTAGGFKRDGTARFELYKDRYPTFYPEDREFLGTILNCGEEGSFDEIYIDAPSVLMNDIYGHPVISDGKLRLYYTGEARPVSSWSHGMAYLDTGKLFREG